VTDDDGNKFLQLDTYGSNSRKLAGKISQTIQFDRGAARQLKELIAPVFPEEP
jgi:hypothetical protein